MVKIGKLSLRYIGRYEILERVRKVAYKLVLSIYMQGVYNVFHIFLLQKYIVVKSTRIIPDHIEIQSYLTRRTRMELGL